MILPNKYIMLSESFIGISAMLLDIIKNRKITVEKLWFNFEKKYIITNKINNPPTYQKFIYTLEFMFLTNMISYNNEGEILNENIKS